MNMMYSSIYLGFSISKCLLTGFINLWEHSATVHNNRSVETTQMFIKI